MKNIISILPREWKDNLNPSDFDGITDIRITESSPIFLYGRGEESVLKNKGLPCIPTGLHLAEIIRSASENSLYSYLEDIKEGFITIKGGHRIGICGKAVYDDGFISNIKNINGINIRVARELSGVSSEIIKKITSGGLVQSTVIISPPGGGKTTILRDIARILGNTPNMRPVLIDSRYELGAENRGTLALDVGKRTLTLSGYRKKDGFSHGVRNLSANVILCDEIAAEDIPSLRFASTCGVTLIVTAHANSLQELKRKMDISFAKRVVVLSADTRNAQIFAPGDYE